MTESTETPLPVILKHQTSIGAEDDIFHDFRYSFVSTPSPPSHLYDSTDLELLNLARCRAFIRVVDINPKSGTFRLRMKCLWLFRTLNSKEEAEILLRGVPGVRMPGLIVTVEESRIWKDLEVEQNMTTPTTTRKTLCWRGTSIFTMDGFKAFNMLDFPFDRHMLNLDRIEFVWRSHKDEADYHMSLKCVEFSVSVSSMLPEWRTLPPYIRPLNELHRSGRSGTTPGSPESDLPSYASKFMVHLRIQRKHKFYSWQVFLVAYLITLLSCMPLAMPPETRFLGDRLGISGTGMLTLVAFKYGISELLPSVPYQTYTDKFLLMCILTLFTCAIVTLYPHRITQGDEEKEYIVDIVEHTLGFVVFVVWTGVLFYTLLYKPMKRLDWQSVLIQDQESQDPFGKEEKIEIDREVVVSFNKPRSRSTLFGLLAGKGETPPGVPRSPHTSLTSTDELSGHAQNWTLRQVCLFIAGLELTHCLPKFKENAVDGKMLVQLAQDDLITELGLTKLQAKKVLDRLKQHLSPV